MLDSCYGCWICSFDGLALFRLLHLQLFVCLHCGPILAVDLATIKFGVDFVYLGCKGLACWCGVGCCGLFTYCEESG